MKAYIHANSGRPWNEECESAFRGFQSLGIESFLFSSTDELRSRKREDVVVGGTLIMYHALGEYGIFPENLSYPSELIEYYGRSIRKKKLCDLERESFPLFIKPLKDKSAPGIIVNAFPDVFKTEYSHLPADSEIWCSEVVDFISEWRCFVRYGKILDIRLYHGNRDARCDDSIILDAVSLYRNSPASYALDFGVTSDGRTIIVEMNDAIALGSYGLQDTLYAELLATRWAELTSTADSLREIGPED